MTKKALIVDDSRLACRVLAKMLDGFNIVSAEVYSAERALEYLKHKQPDVIFLDHIMPGMNGLEMMKILKNNPTTATIPVMMYTSKEGSVYFGQARSLGAIDILPKGLEEKHLRNVLEKTGLLTGPQQTPLTGKPQQGNSPKKNSNVVEALSQPNSPDLVKLPHSSAEPQPEKKPANQAQQGLKRFWYQTIEPYLERQKGQHQKEQQYNTNLQTRKLNRELHHTLEQFEHALVLRMESHAEFVASTEESSKSSRRKRYLTLASLILALQVGIFWQLWSANQLTHELMLAQLENNSHRQIVEEQLTSLDEVVRQLVLSTNTSPTNSDQNFSKNKFSDNSYSSGVMLVDQQNQVIAMLSLANTNDGLYSGTTSNGYRFTVNSQGLFVSNHFDRYFLSQDCMGDVFVKSFAGVILKGENEPLWYVNRFASKVAINVNSILTAKNTCTVLANEELSLYQLQPNVYFETGIDENQPVQIIFK